MTKSKSPLEISCTYLEEPLLAFGNDGLHVDPKEGISRFGPWSWQPARRHPSVIRVGLIGTAETMEKATLFLRGASEGIEGEGPHMTFPGFKKDRGFFSEMDFTESRQQVLSQSEIATLSKIEGQRPQFEGTLSLLDEKMAMLAESDQPPDYVVVALPDRLVKLGRTVEYRDPKVGLVHRDLRRAFKARAMRYRIPTQLLLSDTPRLKVTPGSDHPAEVAWDLLTGAYFKAGGSPWAPTGIPSGTCFIGVSFYRSLGSESRVIQTSLVQAFDEHGEGLVLRGHEFEWDPDREGARAPHLTGDMAAALVEMALDRYEREQNTRPRRVVVQKTSRFWPSEADGFRQALQKRADRFDLVSLTRNSDVRLFPESKYPPLRGTSFQLGALDFLYTTGFQVDLGDYTYGRHVPSPLFLADHHGHDTPRGKLLREVMILTKLNWNSARLGGLWPITLRFSRRVGDILKEIPPDLEPLPQSKFYM